jgi:hypothetical protein
MDSLGESAAGNRSGSERPLAEFGHGRIVPLTVAQGDLRAQAAINVLDVDEPGGNEVPVGLPPAAPHAGGSQAMIPVHLRADALVKLKIDAAGLHFNPPSEIPGMQCECGWHSAPFPPAPAGSQCVRSAPVRRLREEPLRKLSTVLTRMEHLPLEPEGGPSQNGLRRRSAVLARCAEVSSPFPRDASPGGRRAGAIWMR